MYFHIPPKSPFEILEFSFGTSRSFFSLSNSTSLGILWVLTWKLFTFTLTKANYCAIYRIPREKLAMINFWNQNTFLMVHPLRLKISIGRTFQIHVKRTRFYVAVQLNHIFPKLPDDFMQLVKIRLSIVRIAHANFLLFVFIFLWLSPFNFSALLSACAARRVFPECWIGMYEKEKENKKLRENRERKSCREKEGDENWELEWRSEEIQVFNYACLVF